jgi:hypothetical protein
MARDERRRPVVDAGRRVTEHTSGSRQHLKIPEGLGLFMPKKPGAYKIEVIPYEMTKSSQRFVTNYAKPGEWYYERTHWVHDNVGVNNDKAICLAKNFNKPCPICEHRAMLLKRPDAEAEKLAYALKPKERQLFLVLDHAEPHKGLQLWDVSNWCFGKQLDQKIAAADDDDRKAFRRFADSEEGRTLKLIGSEESTGDGGGKYMKFSVDAFKERSEALDPDLFDHGHVLDDMVKEMDYDGLKKFFLQGDDEDAEKKAGSKGKKEDDDKPTGGFAKPGGKKKPDPDDDDPPAKKKDEEPAPKGKVGKGDTVTFVYRDKRWTGKAVGFNAETGLVRVECEGRENPFSVDVDDITVVDKAGAKKPTADDDDPPARKPKPKEDDDGDAEFDKRAPAKKKPAADDDDDDPPARKPKPKDEEEPAAKKRKPAVDDDDDPPPRSKKPAAEEKPAKKPAAKKPDDDDWDD